MGLLWAQDGNITGIVLTAEDQTPIHGANIYSETLGIGTVSQVDGSFTLNKLPKDTVSLTFSMIGFKDIKTIVVINELINDLGTIIMFKDTLKLDQINVEAHHELQPKDFISSIVVSGNKYHTNLKSSLALTIKEETGLAIRSIGQATSQQFYEDILEIDFYLPKMASL